MKLTATLMTNCHHTHLPLPVWLLCPLHGVARISSVGLLLQYWPVLIQHICHGVSRCCLSGAREPCLLSTVYCQYYNIYTSHTRHSPLSLASVVFSPTPAFSSHTKFSMSYLRHIICRKIKRFAIFRIHFNGT